MGIVSLVVFLAVVGVILYKFTKKKDEPSEGSGGSGGGSSLPTKEDQDNKK
jgi:hypothetical protein